MTTFDPEQRRHAEVHGETLARITALESMLSRHDAEAQLLHDRIEERRQRDFDRLLERLDRIEAEWGRQLAELWRELRRNGNGSRRQRIIVSTAGLGGAGGLAAIMWELLRWLAK